MCNTQKFFVIEVHNIVPVILGRSNFVVVIGRAVWNGACSCLKPAAFLISDFYSGRKIKYFALMTYRKFHT